MLATAPTQAAKMSLAQWGSQLAHRPGSTGHLGRLPMKLRSGGPTLGARQRSYLTAPAARYTQLSPRFAFHFNTPTHLPVRGLGGRSVPADLQKACALSDPKTPGMEKRSPTSRRKLGTPKWNRDLFSPPRNIVRLLSL